jgi:hypothetical protein
VEGSMRQKSHAEKSIKAFRDGVLFLLWSKGGKCITYTSPVNGRITAGVLSAGREDIKRDIKREMANV